MVRFVQVAAPTRTGLNEYKDLNVCRWAASMLMDVAALRSNLGSAVAKSRRDFTPDTEIEFEFEFENIETENPQNITAAA